MPRRLLAAAGVMLAAACIHIAPRPIDPAQTAQRLEARTLAEYAATKNVTHWDLDALTNAALAFHPELDVARAEAAVARAAIVTAGERPNPTLNAGVEHKAEARPWITTLGIDVPIETANKRRLRVRAAQDLAKEADFAIAQRAWEVRSAIRAQLVALASSRAAGDVIARQHDVQQDIVEALTKRLEVGAGSQIELSQARIAAMQTALLLRDRQSLAASARARLATAIGIPEAGFGDAKPDFDLENVRRSLTLNRMQALTGRPDVLAALADYAASESALRVELSKQYPDVHIAPGIGWDQGAARWDLGFSAVLPVFTRNRGAIGEAEARRAASEARFVALQARVIGALDDATARYRAAMQKLDDANAIVAGQERLVASVQRSFDAGETDRVALRTAQLELESARLARIDALTDAQTALGALEDAVEGPVQ
jgi:outer membrane protein, heavy metal efflux system